MIGLTWPVFDAAYPPVIYDHINLFSAWENRRLKVDLGSVELEFARPVIPKSQSRDRGAGVRKAEAENLWAFLTAKFISLGEQDGRCSSMK
jgi:hypothetical protein